ncbi:hypothetical protein CU097_004070 [Rhizopus azygosporus]|uniref:Saccharopine dehydrogenase NADP binding domain-containing protein n=2 Tax=Rhizopus TaxID=4842 RepID=A0A367JXC9_RHIAZ|nr:saccharopine dehydrogenase [Rhizopus microsporus]RCH94321.1 hypothetical protein CU097_004070 [Rhizopus azygosporus]CEI90396.1 Putative Saccharopine dehydrogenase [Rhizopus microsporus]CEJ00377.1 Putative Saccharopine dehydrogenase [Rhizopus microsporus]
MTDYQKRKYDIIIFGATGYTGELTAEYLAERLDKSINWAIAGRSLVKLEKVRDHLVEIDPSLQKIDLLIADTQQPETLDNVVSQTRVAVSTVGPYIKYGTPLVEACIRQKTHYVDITGEYSWVKQIIDQFDEKAKQEKIMIVPCCGFDSAPSDLGVWMLANHIHSKHNLSLGTVKASMTKLAGGVSGGTIHSFIEAATQRMEGHGDPYLLATRKGIDKPTLPTLYKDRDFDNKWQTFFFMSVTNEKVVRRSWSIWADRGQTYGNMFSYREYMSLSFIPAVLFTCFLYTIVPMAVLLIRAPIIGEKIKALLPGPGYGPRGETRKLGHFELQLVGSAESEPYEDSVRAKAIVKGFSDPGYGDTPRMLVEAALCIIKSFNELPGKDGGVLTPSTAFGQTLIERLRKDDAMVFQVDDLKD